MLNSVSQCSHGNWNSLVGSTSASLPHHHLFESITVTQSRSEKLPSDYCLDPLSMPPAHFIGPELRARLLGSVRVEEIQAIAVNKHQRAKNYFAGQALLENNSNAWSRMISRIM